MEKEKIKYFHESLKLTSEVGGILRVKQRVYDIITVTKNKVDQYIDNGWEKERELKSKFKLKKHKSEKKLFKEKSWGVFAKLDFNYISIDEKFNTVFLDECAGTAFDFLIADSETILLVNIFFSEQEKTISKLKSDVELIGKKKTQIFNAVRKYLPGKRKVKIIFVTKNLALSDEDKVCLKNYDITHFNEDAIVYYDELRKHLGSAAKFQLLGSLFPNLTIPELDNRIPAIEGEMGGFTYYSFSIEPEKLLKIGYVLHRNNANAELMPTYQRLIKKTRLTAIQDFIEHGGFFPNSLVINIDNGGKKLQFDKSGLQHENSLSRIGVLHLPKTYRSAYIIDGQHRLYGYSNSKYKSKNTVPVVAFVNFDQQKQVKLFLDINQNQKAVSRSLKNDLKANILWNSDKPAERIEALILTIAIKLGEDVNSPLFNRIQLGENTKNETRCITTESIKIGLDKGHFFPQYSSKNKLINLGTFFNENNEKTKELIYPFLVDYFKFISVELRDDWNMGEADYGYLSINAGIESLIRIVGDICKFLIERDEVNPLTNSAQFLLDKIKPFIYPVIDYFKGLGIDQKKTLKKSYGAAGKLKYWRTLQEVIHKVKPEFNPEGLERYLKDEEKAFNAESTQIVKDIEAFLKQDVKSLLEGFYGENWIKLGVPRSIYIDASSLAVTKNADVLDKSEEVAAWDCLYLINYKKIMLHKSNWSELFNKRYTKPGEEKLEGGRENKLNWIEKLNTIRNKTSHSQQVKEEEYNFLCELRDWLLDGGIDE